MPTDKTKRRETRHERQKQHAFIAVRNNHISLRTAAANCRMATSTFHRQFHGDTATGVVPSRIGRPPALTEEEETSILETMERFANRGFPMCREDLIDCVELLCNTFSQERLDGLSFKGGRPGRKFIKGFERRHKKRIKYGKASKQENKRFVCTNAENLTRFYAELEATMRDNKIDSRRLANLDESGVSPDRDRLGVSRRGHYGLRSATLQQRTVEFSYTKRVTIMPVIFANGESRNPLFVFEAKTVPYRTVDLFGEEIIESVPQCLPRDSIVKYRRDGCGVNKKIFIEWAKEFVGTVQDLTEGNRKVLLLYDAYRSHMSFESLTILERGGVIAFAIPAHTSGTTQPLDVGVFQPWKANINIILQSMCSPTSHNVFDLFDLCKIMTAAYRRAFTAENIQNGFSKTGINPFNPKVVLDIPRPKCNECPTVTVTPAEMEIMLDEKRFARRESAGVTPVVLKRGFLNTAAGLNLTSEEAMKTIRKREEQESTKAQNKYRKLVMSDAKWAVESKRRRDERSRFDEARAKLHVKLYGDPFVLPRPLKLRRKHAAEQHLMGRAQIFGMENLSFEEKLRHPGFNPSQDQWEHDVDF